MFWINKLWYTHSVEYYIVIKAAIFRVLHDLRNTFFFFFFGPHPQHMEVLSLGVQLEL